MESFIRKILVKIIGIIVDITFTNWNIIIGIKSKPERNDKATTNIELLERNRVKEITDSSNAYFSVISSRSNLRLRHRIHVYTLIAPLVHISGNLLKPSQKWKISANSLKNHNIF